MPAPVNEKLLLATDFVLHTRHNVFLTGKAGTGKTTFLHQIKGAAVKRLAVVAPTGVAAINAGGVTIHSLFQLPFGPLTPGATTREGRKFNRDKIRLLRTLDLLIIDEISMVRADVLDGIDEVLRRYRNPNVPFGGVQLLMIGDMQQLPPVIRDDDWALLRPYYDTGYFFGSRALREIPYVSIELTHIYRQADERFITLLNAIREKTISSAQLADLNQRYIADFRPADDAGYITLSTHNNTAQQINSTRLAELPGQEYAFEATTTGDFPASAYPTESELTLKVGAQVMFIKNDISREKLYYNGKIGRVLRIDEEDGVIYVEGQADGDTIMVTPAEWQNIRYTLDPATKEITAEVIGTFTQYPLRLAWAITIHKSQGLTFERAIIDASAAFAHGQVYVALSRCKTLDGLVLRTPIPSSSIKTEQTLEVFHEQVQQQTPTEQHLHEAKRLNQETLLDELFSFEHASTLLYRCRREVNTHGASFSDELAPALEALENELRPKARDIGRRFAQQLPHYFAQEPLPEANEALQERVRKAAAYFGPLLANDLLPALEQAPTDSDNKAVREALLDVMDELERELFVKLKCFERCAEGFDALGYLQARNHAELDFKPSRKRLEKATESGGSNRDDLYKALVRWRDEMAAEHNTTGYMVLPTKTIVELVKTRPNSTAELLAIKGFGKTKVKQIGPDIMRILDAYRSGTGTTRSGTKPAKADKEPTHETTIRLLLTGLSPQAIADKRGLSLSTIETHLTQAIKAGQVPVESLVAADTIDRIRAFVRANQGLKTSEIRAGLNNSVSFGEIRMVVAAGV
ncbi:helix-turn-helix domain-containing protein [Rudanella lutea]|uniref:helix-turn-helix domain-containing protein n=1 Tax=Rudanella lutea TaxID=451374 RepID=UPI00037322C1|nr:helix-turn-helix domain-containing protein [Rudanella lutea]